VTNAKRGTHHYESSLSLILEVLSLDHILPGERSASLCHTAGTTFTCTYQHRALKDRKAVDKRT